MYLGGARRGRGICVLSVPLDKHKDAVVGSGGGGGQSKQTATQSCVATGTGHVWVGDCLSSSSQRFGNAINSASDDGADVIGIIPVFPIERETSKIIRVRAATQ